MRPLLAAWDERIRSETSRFDELPAAAAAASSVLRPAAREEDIVAAERRLGASLPPSYRAFLLISNGAYGSSLGAQRSTFGTSFLPVQEIGRAAELDAAKVALWTGEEDLNDPENDVPPRPGEPSEVHWYEPLGHAIRITAPDEAFQDMLVPRDGQEEWEFWSFSKEGAISHYSFADFLVDYLARPDLSPNPNLADDYVATVRSGSPIALMKLAEIADPRTGELAREVLSDEGIEERRRAFACQVLRLVGNPDCVHVLRQAYETATGWDMRRASLEALYAFHAPCLEKPFSFLAEHDPDPAVRRWADSVVAELTAHD